MNSVFVFLWFLLFALSLGQAPMKCHSPPAIEGMIYQFDEQQDYMGLVHMSYDAPNKRVRLLEELDHTKEKDFFDILILHKEGIEYHFNIKTKTCQKKALRRPFEPFSIPSNATFAGEFYLGSSSSLVDGVLVSSWYGVTDDGHYHTQWTVKGCIPVMYQSVSKTYGTLFTSFNDIVLGISDPKVFIPPKECTE